MTLFVTILKNNNLCIDYNPSEDRKFEMHDFVHSRITHYKKAQFILSDIAEPGIGYDHTP